MNDVNNGVNNQVRGRDPWVDSDLDLALQLTNERVGDLRGTSPQGHIASCGLLIALPEDPRTENLTGN